MDDGHLTEGIVVWVTNIPQSTSKFAHLGGNLDELRCRWMASNVYSKGMKTHPCNKYDTSLHRHAQTQNSYSLFFTLFLTIIIHIHTYRQTDTNIYIYTPTYIHSYIQTDTNIYIYIYTPTHIHTYIHTDTPRGLLSLDAQQ